MIFNQDCIQGAKDHIVDGSVDLLICDPPFGIGESGFDKHYKRKKDKIIDGYVEAPQDYAKWSELWITEAYRVLKDNGSFYVVSGHTNLVHILNAATKLNFHMINHIIWKFNFGVFTKKKFVTSHYHILYYKKSEKAEVKFNQHCRFGSQERDIEGSLLYQDLEDVWTINKEYTTNEKINNNKLPEELIKKMILYSSEENDIVCDFFLGNFTTAVVAKKLNRQPVGFELNPDGFAYHSESLKNVINGCDLSIVTNISPSNQGKRISGEEKEVIVSAYLNLRSKSISKKDAIMQVGEKFGRGYFSILNLLEKSAENRQKIQRKGVCFDCEGQTN